MDDLKHVTQYLAGTEHAVVAGKGGAILGAAEGRGVRPFMDLAVRLGPALRGAALADRVVGRAVALGCVYYGVASVHAQVMSEDARAVLEGAGISHACDRMVPAIRNREGTGPCPVEARLAGVQDPAEAMANLAAFLGVGLGSTTLA